MNAKRRPQEDSRQLRRRSEILEAVAGQLDTGAQSEATGSGEVMAGRAFLSRYHFQRVAKNALGETPGAMRRRLLLERAAFDLRSTLKSVREVGLEAGYESLSGFSRAFRQLFGVSPSAYRRAARAIRWLPGNSGVHYDSQAQEAVCYSPGGKNMDLMDRLFESDYTSKRRIFACARLLSDAQLDAPLAFRHNLMPFCEPARTLRESLSQIAGEVWVEAMLDRVGWQPEDDNYRRIMGTSVGAMSERFESFSKARDAFVRKVRDENLWDQEWVDDTCDSPETFSIGGVIEATLTWQIACRLMLERMLEQMGFQLHEMDAVAARERS